MPRFDDILFHQLDSLVVQHPLMDVASEAIMQILEGSDHFHDHLLLPLIGPSRSGKTRLLELCKARYEEAHGMDPKRSPVRYVRLPRSKHPKAVLMKLQYALGHPLYYVGNEEEMQIRCMDLLDRLVVRAIMFDETQHSVSTEGVVNYVLADLIKAMLDEAGVTLICAGLEDTAAVLEANEQLTGRCMNSIELPRFDWLVETSRIEFINVINAFRDGLPSLRLPDFSDPSIAFRWYVASGGLIGYVHKIFRQALEDAKRDNRLRISLEDLDRAHLTAVYRRGPPLAIFAHSFGEGELSSGLEYAANVGKRRLPETPEPRLHGGRRGRSAGTPKPVREGRNHGHTSISSQSVQVRE